MNYNIPLKYVDVIIILYVKHETPKTLCEASAGSQQTLVDEEIMKALKAAGIRAPGTHVHVHS